ncbi:MAG: SufE family protein [Flavobacteriales bacterium]|nr:SufE family protein [Flavobacteriales bacterium]
MTQVGTIDQAQDEVIDEFLFFKDWQDRYEHLIELGKDLPLIAPERKTDDNLIRGCQSRVWLFAELKDGSIHFSADSDSMITKGIVSLLVRILDMRRPAEVIKISLADLYSIERIGLREHLFTTRSNGLVAMLDQMKRYAVAYSTQA